MSVSLQYTAENLLILSWSWNEKIVTNMEVIVNDTSEVCTMLRKSSGMLHAWVAFYT